MSGILVRARVFSPRVLRDKGILRAGPLNPYLADTIAEEARRGGPGTRLELLLSPEASDTDITEVDGTFARLRNRGVHVTVQRRQLTSNAHRRNF